MPKKGLIVHSANKWACGCIVVALLIGFALGVTVTFVYQLGDAFSEHTQEFARGMLTEMTDGFVRDAEKIRKEDGIVAAQEYIDEVIVGMERSQHLLPALRDTIQECVVRLRNYSDEIEMTKND